jgi:hypothetical protein
MQENQRLKSDLVLKTEEVQDLREYLLNCQKMSGGSLDFASLDYNAPVIDTTDHNLESDLLSCDSYVQDISDLKKGYANDSASDNEVNMDYCTENRRFSIREARLLQQNK